MTRVDPSPEITMLWLRVCGLSISLLIIERGIEIPIVRMIAQAERQINRE